MFLKNKAEQSALNGAGSSARKTVPTIVSQDMHILGNLMSEGMVDVDGTIEGNIKAQHVTLRANGRLAGDVIAEHAHIHGSVNGLIRAHSVFLYASSHVQGVIMYKSLTVEDGAVVDGKFKRIQDKLLTATGVAQSDDGDDDEESMISSLRLIS
jgi:cytoskeletal protein CcmA (bactofilin family)